MKPHEFACSTILLMSGILARPCQGQKPKQPYDDITLADMPTRSIIQCPVDKWRPLSPYKSIALPWPWWFLPETDEANEDNYVATHPSLPPGIVLPKPLLPTNNATLEKLYSLAIEAYDADVIKQVGPRSLSLYPISINFTNKSDKENTRSSTVQKMATRPE
jgi:hypothetical protein